jgi:hypothetical protein
MVEIEVHLSRGAMACLVLDWYADETNSPPERRD